MQVLREIDRGGFGVVHEVIERGKHVARKSFDPKTSSSDELEKLQRRFAREVRIQSKLHHPNIMPILDQDLDAKPPWFTMPLASQSLIKQIESNRAQGIVDPNPWQDILAAVEELHRLGYVHRDLKPENVLKVAGTWVLSDFGLILPTARDTTVLTSSHSAYGSHYYAAPEQAQDFRNTPEQADIFALGCILHDSLDPTPRRIPFAQIRIGGPYGPILEKCTELDPRKRFPNVGALRSVLFDLWRTTQFTAPIQNDGDKLNCVLENPNSADCWRSLVGHIEALDQAERDPLLRAINAELIVKLNGLDDMLFGRVMSLICAWAGGTAFPFAYCDILGDRLLEAYRISPTRIQCQIVLAALQLSVTHNRWHVMKQAGAMLSPTADTGLVDRIIIEMGLDSGIEAKLRMIETTVRWSRDRWHPKIADYLACRHPGDSV